MAEMLQQALALTPEPTQPEMVMVSRQALEALLCPIATSNTEKAVKEPMAVFERKSGRW